MMYGDEGMLHFVKNINKNVIKKKLLKKISDKNYLSLSQ